MIILWDRLQAHRARRVREYLERHPEIIVEYFPPYAPELNPEEYCHGYIKQRMRNDVANTLDQLWEHVTRELRRLRHQPAIIASFFRRAGLRVAPSG
jgi:transposase